MLFVLLMFVTTDVMAAEISLLWITPQVQDSSAQNRKLKAIDPAGLGAACDVAP
jgi:hypothetical protein